MFLILIGSHVKTVAQRLQSWNYLFVSASVFKRDYILPGRGNYYSVINNYETFRTCANNMRHTSLSTVVNAVLDDPSVFEGMSAEEICNQLRVCLIHT